MNCFSSFDFIRQTIIIIYDKKQTNGAAPCLPEILHNNRYKQKKKHFGHKL